MIVLAIQKIKYNNFFKKQLLPRVYFYDLALIQGLEWQLPSASKQVRYDISKKFRVSFSLFWPQAILLT